MNPVTNEHLERALQLARRADWPDETLRELLAAQRRAVVVQGLAQRLANGQGMTLPPAPTALADQPPPVPLRACDYPPRRAGTVPGNPNHRRASDGPDRKSLAAGDRNDD